MTNHQDLRCPEPNVPFNGDKISIFHKRIPEDHLIHLINILRFQGDLMDRVGPIVSVQKVFGISPDALKLKFLFPIGSLGEFLQS